MPTRVVLSCGSVPVIDRLMAVVDITPSEVNSPLYRHLVLILDCSGSMWSSLESVKAHARRFVTALDETNYVSVVVFSGHNESRLLVGPTQCKAAGKQMLDQAIRGAHVMGLTVFSEPLKKVLELIKTSHVEGMAHQAVLFTDGCVVPTFWSPREEEERALAVARELYEFGAAVSVIGYRGHYDDDFVTRIMRAGGSSGIFRHMNDVDDFGEVISDVESSFARVTLSKITLSIIPDAGQVTAVYRTLPEVLKLSTNGNVVVSGLYGGKLTCYIDLTNATDTVRFKGQIDGLDVDIVRNAEPLSAEQQADCVRVVAAHMAASGNTAEASELFIQVGEEGVAEMLTEAYTQRDRRTTRDKCRRAYRTNAFIGAGLKASGPSHCVLNVLAILAEDPSVIVSLPSGVYQRGGILREDPRVIHSPLGRTLKVVSYTGNEKRLNFSLTAQKDVKVLPADGDGKPIDGEPTAAVVFRTYNLIRDGELVMEEIEASMSEVSFMRLQEAKVIEASETWKAGKSYTLRLGDMKMVSSAWARPGSLKLIETLQEIEELKARQTLLNAHIKALGKPEVPEFDGNVYRDRPETVETAVKEYYNASCVELRLMGYKAQDYSSEVSQLSVAQAIAEVKKVRKDLRRLRFRARCVTYACEATGWKSVNWGTPKQTSRGQFPKQEYTCKFGDQTVKRVTWDEEVAFS